MCSGYWLEYNVNIQKSCIHIMYIGYYIALVGGHRKRTLCQVWVGFFLNLIFMYFLEQLKIILQKLSKENEYFKCEFVQYLNTKNAL